LLTQSRLDRDTAQAYARWFHALSDPNRVLIVRFLAQQHQPVPVGVIVEHLGIAQPTVSHHLKILSQVRFVTRRRQGTNILYAVNPACEVGLPSAADAVMGLLHTQHRTEDGPRSTLPMLLLIGSGDRRYREYILAAVSRHFRLWLLDSVEPTWQLPYVDGTTRVDTRDPDALIAAATLLVARLRPAGVFTYDESLVHAAAHLAEALGLPGSPPRAVLACRDKAATRSALAAADVPQPASEPVATADEAIAAAARIGYPVIVKSRGLAGSLGVLRADQPADVPSAFAAAGGAVWPGVPRYTADVLVEQFLTGPEISVDAVVVDGACTPLVIARKQTGMAPFFEETGHTVDADDPLLRDPALLAQLDLVHKSLGYTNGATHSEFKLTEEGPRLVEINARLGGDFIPYLGALATGCDPVVAAAQVAAGRRPDTTPRCRRVAAIRFLYPEHDCEAVDVVVHTARRGPTIHAAVATAAPGTRLALPPRGYLSRYGYVIAVGDDPAQVVADLARPADLVELHARPLSD
jgi:biotin carboxylase/DNA-binding transcriptional ArsR family regulator